MASSKFSDKLINSSGKYLNNLMKHPNVIGIYVTGEAQNAEKGVALYWRDATHVNECFIDMCDAGLKSANTVEEKTFYGQLRAHIRPMIDELNADYERRFGKIDEKILAKPIKKSTFDYNENMMSCKTMDEFVIFNLATIWILVEASNAMRRHPKFKPNPCFDFLYGKDYSAHVNGMKLLADSIGARVSAEEEARLSELYYRCLQHEIDIFNFA